MAKSHIAILASGSGTNAEEIMKFFRDHPNADVSVLLSNNPKAFALQRAEKYNVPTHVFNREQFSSPMHILEILSKHEVTHLVLAGFLWLIPDYLIKSFPKKIINIHPALLPKFGGKGMYGTNIHEAIRASGEKETGITIHEVNEHYDDGEILFQAKCPIEKDETPDQIADKVHQLEYQHYPRVIESWIKG
ncbi:MAG TPA: phosphoribosylglycinamide formyltransferase [Cyclobacteriaceae bacterium]|nr:phosphoribosylglycinamide formyltransferase [Cyclobacteriaceae bacterium]